MWDVGRVKKPSTSGRSLKSPQSIEEKTIKHIFAGANRVCTETWDGGSGTKINYFYDGNTAIIERNEAGKTTARYTRGLSLGGGIGSIISKYEAGKDYYYLYDGQGNVTHLTDEDGKVIIHYEYDAFGSIVYQDGSLENSYQYQTKEYDSQSGFVYFGARYYDPAIGRFTTADPLGMVDGPNVYVYLNNNPIGFVDPWGLRGEEGEYLSEGDFYKVMKNVLRYMINYIPENERYKREHYEYMDSIFFNTSDKTYIFRGEHVLGGEINYFAQGMLYRHFQLPKSSIYILPTAWKALKTYEYKTGQETRNYSFPPSKNVYKFTKMGYIEYDSLRKEVESEGLDLDWHRHLFGF